MWYLTSDETLVTDHNLTKSRFETTLYSKHVHGKLAFVLVTKVDIYIYAGNYTTMLEF